MVEMLGGFLTSVPPGHNDISFVEGINGEKVRHFNLNFFWQSLEAGQAARDALLMNNVLSHPVWSKMIDLSLST